MNNRQLKFRAWDRLEKRYIYPDKGYQGHYVLDLNGKFYNLQNGSGGNDYVVQQWTGFKDIDGRDIWEGDVIEFETTNKKYRGLIDYNIGAFIILGNSLDEEKTITHIWLKDIHKDIYNFKIKVIGSSFENCYQCHIVSK